MPRPEVRRELVVVGDDVYNAVIGYRMWIAEPESGYVRLLSLNHHSFQWERVTRAACSCGPHLDHSRTQPGQDPFRIIERYEHTCGIYAWAKRTRPVTRSQGLVSQPRYVVCGEVALWGDVHVHALGYRGEFAKPTAFYVVPEMSDLERQFIGLAAIQWGVPMVTLEDTHTIREITDLSIGVDFGTDPPSIWTP